MDKVVRLGASKETHVSGDKQLTPLPIARTLLKFPVSQGEAERVVPNHGEAGHHNLSLVAVVWGPGEELEPC